MVEKKRKYIVRRLTPLECCRLQGFPDWWEAGCDDRVKAFRDLRSAWPEFDKQFLNSRNFEFDWNWYRDHLDTEVSVEGSDSARYKMWGNGIALPCAVDVLRRMAKLEREVGRSCIKGVFLDELDPERGRADKEIMPECGIMCQIAYDDA